MAEIIKAKYNSEGKVIVRVFKDDYDVTKNIKDGIATLNVYGRSFEIHVAPTKTAKKVKVKQAKVKAEKVDVGFIETPNKD